LNEHVFVLTKSQIYPEPTGSLGCAEQLEYSAPPKPHQLIAIVVETQPTTTRGFLGTVAI
jgi:hypothetical protein